MEILFPAINFTSKKFSIMFLLISIKAIECVFEPFLIRRTRRFGVKMMLIEKDFSRAFLSFFF